MSDKDELLFFDTFAHENSEVSTNELTRLINRVTNKKEML